MVEFSVPAGPVGVKVDVHLPPWSKVRAWWRRRSDPSFSVQLKLLSARVQIDRANEGSAVFFMEVLNLFRRPVTIDRLVLRHWSWSSFNLPLIQPVLNGERSVVRRRSLGNLAMTTELNDKAIRVIRDADVKARNVFSTPHVSLSMSGQLYVLESATPVYYDFTVACPEVSVYWDEEPGERRAPAPTPFPLADGLRPTGDQWGATMSPEDVAAVSDAVKRMRTAMTEAGIALTQDQWQFINDRLDYLVVAAARQAREDWKHTAIGVLVTIVTGLALAPEAAQAVWRVLTQALEGAVRRIGR